MASLKPPNRRFPLVKHDPETSSADSREDDVPSEPLQRITFMWQWITEREPVYFDSVLRDHLVPVSAALNPTDRNRATSTFLLKVPRSLCNGGGNLHGGAVALIFDLLTSLTVGVCAREGFWDSGHVSRNLNCTYIRPAPEGSEVLVESDVIHLGKTMCVLSGVMRMKDTGKICYVCEHGKVKVDGYKLPENDKEASKL
ncbi:hypothetical protein BT63DRAFT_423551 [Microthyrium microscopicum]|uniref:Thioesterase domain-containing protein n=1 Tax=Microthyrium microscopicum TaxID=703497 RepID=A0A6A6UHR0_9PEZI|nr:hypothetical protein BT63DRAFT_423551 [Microthyrium microscopicum]